MWDVILNVMGVTCFRYWNDPDILQKLGHAMGIGTSGEGEASVERSVAEEVQEESGYEDESIVHHTASIGDVEVCF